MSIINEASGLPIISTKVEIGAYETKFGTGSFSIGTGQMHSFLLITQTDSAGHEAQKFLYFGPDKTDGKEASVYPQNPENAENWHYGSAYDIIKASGRAYEANDSTLFHEYNFTKGEHIRAVYGDYQGSYEQDKAEHFVTIAEGDQYHDIGDRLLQSAEKLVGSGYRYSALNYNSNASLATILEDNGLEWQAPDDRIYPGSATRIPLSDTPPVPVTSVHVSGNSALSKAPDDLVEISLSDVVTPAVEMVEKLNPLNFSLSEKVKGDFAKVSNAVAHFVDDSLSSLRKVVKRAGNASEKTAAENSVDDSGFVLDTPINNFSLSKNIGGAFSKVYDAANNVVAKGKKEQAVDNNITREIGIVQKTEAPAAGFFEKVGKGIVKVSEAVSTAYERTTKVIDDYVLPSIGLAKATAEAISVVYREVSKVAVPLSGAAFNKIGGAVNKVKGWGKKIFVEDSANESVPVADAPAEKTGIFEKIGNGLGSGLAKIGETASKISTTVSKTVESLPVVGNVIGTVKGWGKKSVVEDSARETATMPDAPAEKTGIFEKIGNGLGSGLAKIGETASKISTTISKTVESLPVVGSVIGAVKGWGKKTIIEEATQDSYFASQNLEHDSVFNAQSIYSSSHEETYQQLPII